MSLSPKLNSCFFWIANDLLIVVFQRVLSWFRSSFSVSYSSLFFLSYLILSAHYTVCISHQLRKLKANRVYVPVQLDKLKFQQWANLCLRIINTHKLYITTCFVLLFICIASNIVHIRWIIYWKLNVNSFKLSHGERESEWKKNDSAAIWLICWWSWA